MEGARRLAEETRGPRLRPATREGRQTVLFVEAAKFW